MKRVYLAGLISTERPATFAWRKEAFDELKWTFEVLSPLRDKLDLARHSKDGGVTDTRLTSKDVILRDHSDVLSSDLIIVHLEAFGSLRPLMGTLFELAWAWEHKIPVIAIAYEDNAVMRIHPFLAESVSHFVTTTAEAIRFAKEYYA